MKFHITIKNNETGEILHDQDCNAIIGGICDNEKKHVRSAYAVQWERPCFLCSLGEKSNRQSRSRTT